MRSGRFSYSSFSSPATSILIPVLVVLIQLRRLGEVGDLVVALNESFRQEGHKGQFVVGLVVVIVIVVVVALVAVVVCIEN